MQFSKEAIPSGKNGFRINLPKEIIKAYNIRSHDLVILELIKVQRGTVQSS